MYVSCFVKGTFHPTINVRLFPTHPECWWTVRGSFVDQETFLGLHGKTELQAFTWTAEGDVFQNAEQEKTIDVASHSSSTLQLLQENAATLFCCEAPEMWTMKLPLTFHQHMLSRSWLNFVFLGWTVPSVWLLKRLERERELAVSHQTRLTWTPEPSAAITTRAQKLLERFNLTYFHCSNKQSGWCQMQKMQLNNWSVDEADIHDEISTIWEDTWTAAATAALDSVTTVTMTLWWKLTQTGGR